MKRFLPLAVLVILIQCSPKIAPLTKTYQAKPYEAISDNNKDIVWDKIVDFFAKNGLSIKLIDRSSGLIVSDATTLTYTHEDDKGNLKNPKAWVVLNKIYKAGNKLYIEPTSLTGEWNIRIKSTSDNKTNINVNLVNIKYTYLNSSGMPEKDSQYFVNKFQAQSTGKFEEFIFNNVK